jgi:hypothetical protein
MIFIWINEGEGWEPHVCFETDAEDLFGADDSSVMSEVQAEVTDLREQGIKVKLGPAF